MALAPQLFGKQAGPSLIGLGLSVVLAAHVWSSVPIAAAIMLIGYGATVSSLGRIGNQELLGLLNLTVYATLGCLTVAAQTHTALNGSTGRVGFLLAVDHVLAVALLAVLVRTVVRNVSSLPT